jgi:DNA-binding NtrC family response regulator
MTSKRKPTVCIVEDEEKMRDILRINLSNRYILRLFKDAESAFGEIKKEPKNRHPDIIVTDVRLPGMDGIEFMDSIGELIPDIPFIVFTGYGSINHAVATIKRGAFDYLAKPIKIEDLIRSIERALSYVEISRSSVEVENRYVSNVDGSELEFITRDPATIEMLQLAQKAATFDSPILIYGETGTGKEIIARYIHDKSGRRAPFVQLNCASIPRDLLEGELFGYKKGSFTGAVRDYAGKIALSDGGTLFLDEIGELPLGLQAKLLRVLEIPEYYPIGSNEKKHTDLHLVVATNRNLRKMVDEGSFRSDLYYRIAVVPVVVPSLRERKCDIMPLVEYFMKQRSAELILSPEAKLQFFNYDWPGNVRELKNVIDRSILMVKNGHVVDRIVIDIDVYSSGERSVEYDADDIPWSWKDFKKHKAATLKEKKEQLEKLFIEKLLIKNGGNVSASAKMAGLDRRQFQDMIRSLDIDVTIFKNL